MIKLCGHLLLILLLLAAAVADARSQETENHSIDKAMGRCIDKDSSTAGMSDCIHAAAQSWDRELNKNYNRLMTKLSAKQKRALKTAQLEWIKYRDTEYELINAVYDTMDGTMYIPMRAEDRLRVVKKRALELASYLELLENN